MRKELLLVLTIIGVLLTVLNTVNASVWTNESLVSRWMFDETTGTTAFDNKSLNNLTNNGATIMELGKMGYSYYLDGSTDYLNKTSFSATSINTAGSISFWFNASATQCADNCRIIEWGNSTDRMGFLIDAFATDNLNVYMRKDNVNIVNNYTGISIQDNLWHHYVLTWNNTKITIWRDGLNFANTTTNGSMKISSAIPFYVGAYIGGTGTYNGKGQIDQIGIWNRTLNDTEIRELWSEGPYGELNIYFSSATDVILYDSTADKQFSFAGVSNISHYWLDQFTSNGTVVLSFGVNYTQQYFFTNNASQINLTLMVQDPISTDLYNKAIRVLGEGDYLQDAIVVIYQSNGSEWNVIGGYMTDSVGLVNVKVTDGGIYKVIVGKTGYTTDSQVYTFSNPTGSTTFINLEKSSAGNIYTASYVTNCTGVVSGNTSCFLVLSSTSNMTSVIINVSKNGVWTGTTYSNTNLINTSYTVLTTDLPYITNITVNSIRSAPLLTMKKNDYYMNWTNATVYNVSFDFLVYDLNTSEENLHYGQSLNMSSGTTLINKVKGSIKYSLIFLALILICVAGLMFYVETKLKGYGILAGNTFLMIIAFMTGLSILWVVIVPIYLVYIYKIVKELYT